MILLNKFIFVGINGTPETVKLWFKIKRKVINEDHDMFGDAWKKTIFFQYGNKMHMKCYVFANLNSHYILIKKQDVAFIIPVKHGYFMMYKTISLTNPFVLFPEHARATMKKYRRFYKRNIDAFV